MRKLHWAMAIALISFSIFSVSAAQNQNPSSMAKTFSGKVNGRCLFKDVRTVSTFIQEKDADGFTVKLNSEGPDQRLQFNLRCNGVTATVRFEQPKRTDVNGPTLASGTRFNTVYSLDGFSQSFVTTTPDSTTGRMRNFPSTSSANRLMTVGFGLRNGGDANIPFPAGNYNFKFTATVTAPL